MVQGLGDVVRSRNKSHELSDGGEHVVSWPLNLLATSPSYDETERRLLHLLKFAAAIQNMPLKQRPCLVVSGFCLVVVGSHAPTIRSVDRALRTWTSGPRRRS